MAKKGYKKHLVRLGKSKKLVLYAGDHVGEALNVIKDLKVYEGTKVLGLVSAAYNQGHKDGAALTLAETRKSLTAIEKKVPHKNPGRPRKAK